MAKFEAKVYKLQIEPHPNADKLEIAKIGDYVSVVRKDAFKTGDLGVYIQEGSIVPDWLLKHMGLWKTDRDVGKGMLSGSHGNRVRAAKFRGVLSQGLVLRLVEYPFHTYIDKVGRDAKGEIIGVSRPCYDFVEEKINEMRAKLYAEFEADFLTSSSAEVKFAPEGADMAEYLGITKYEPPIPIHMAGEVWNAFGKTISYDIENIKKYNEVFQNGEEVVITEKLHGTFACFGWNGVHDSEEDEFIVHSKGLGQQGIAFKLNDANKFNVYVRTFKKYLPNLTEVVEGDLGASATSFYVLGEIFGPIQDLKYGFTEPQFRVFDVFIGDPHGNGRYLDYADKFRFCEMYDFEMVPILYKGPFSKAKVIELTSGMETVTGKATNIREGVIITSATERKNEWIGRTILKSVSEAYLLRNNSDATEYQ
jgi:RNA ligase (TIGR02306 family)